MHSDPPEMPIRASPPEPRDTTFGLTIRKVIIQILAWLLVLVAPFGTVVLAVMTIIWMNWPGLLGMLAVYAALIGLEGFALAYVTNERHAWISQPVPLIVAFALAAVSAPYVMFVYALLKGGAH